MSMHGYDFSNHQGGLNLASVPADFYIFKATEGVGFVDRFCDNFVQQAKSLGKPYGVYHFLDRSDVTAQANFFVENIKGYIGEAILVLDYEMYGRQGPAAAKRFLDRVTELTGVKPLIYMSESVTREENWTEVVTADYGLWVAKYSANEPSVGYWPSYAMWQYTSTPYDANHFYGDLNAWNAYAGKKSTGTTPQPPTPPAPAPVTDTLEGMAAAVQAGQYGNGEDRENHLGKYFTGVQAIVNERAKAITAAQSHAILARETVAGKYGNGAERQRLLGTYYNAVQNRVNTGNY